MGNATSDFSKKKAAFEKKFRIVFWVLVILFALYCLRPLFKHHGGGGGGGFGSGIGATWTPTPPPWSGGGRGGGGGGGGGYARGPPPGPPPQWATPNYSIPRPQLPQMSQQAESGGGYGYGRPSVGGSMMNAAVGAVESPGFIDSAMKYAPLLM